MLIVLYGPDTWRSRQKLAQLKTKYLAEVSHAAYNLISLNARSASAEALSQALSTPPLLARRRMVILEYFLALQHKKIIELLRKEATKGKEGDIIILWEEALPATRDPFITTLTATEYAQEFNLLTRAALGTWIDTACEKLGCTITAPAKEMLSEHIGPDLWRMAGEIEKLCAYTHARTITPDAVTLLVAPSEASEQMFPLLDAVATRDKVKAFTCLHEHLEAGAGEIATCALLLGLFRNMIQLKAYQEEHPQASCADIAKHLHLHPYVVQKSLPRVRLFHHAELIHIFTKLMRADCALKSIRVEKPRVFLDLILVELTSSRLAKQPS